MRHEFLVIGRGGQGILLMGRILGVSVAKYAGLYVAATESYGSETRGTESRVDMVIADKQEEIDYIKVRKPTIFLIMYPFNLDKYLGMVNENTIVFLNKTFIKEYPGEKYREIYGAPYTEIAEEVTGTIRTANMVALGHIIGKTKIVEPEHVEQAIRELVRKDWIDKNIEAFNKGLSLE